MNEVQVDPAEGNLELLETIEGGFLRAPVEAVAPVAHKLPDIIDAAASRPWSPRRLIRPPDTHQPLPQIAQRLICNVHPERLWGRLAHALSSAMALRIFSLAVDATVVTSGHLRNSGSRSISDVVTST